MSRWDIMYRIDYQDGTVGMEKSLIKARRVAFEHMSEHPQKKPIIIYRPSGVQSGMVLQKYEGVILWETFSERHGSVDHKLLKDGKIIENRMRF